MQTKKFKMNWDYIAGFFDGEGCVSVRAHRTGFLRATIFNTHKQSILKVHKFLKKKGINSTIYSRKRKPNWKRCYEVRICQWKSAKAFLEELKNRTEIKRDEIKEKLKVFKINIQRRGFLPKEVLKEHYLNKKMKAEDIAKKFGKSKWNIYRGIKKYKLSQPIRRWQYYVIKK